MPKRSLGPALVTVLLLLPAAPASPQQAKCLAGKTGCIAKYLAALLKCRQLAQTPGKPTDPNTKGCVDKAVAKYTGGDEPAKGCFAKLEAKNPNDCHSPTASPSVQALAEDCVADLVAVVMTPTTSTTTTTTTTLGPGCDSEPAVFSGITAQHNATRASAIPPPSPPLDPLCWSNS